MDFGSVATSPTRPADRRFVCSHCLEIVSARRLTTSVGSGISGCDVRRLTGAEAKGRRRRSQATLPTLMRNSSKTTP